MPPLAQELVSAALQRLKNRADIIVAFIKSTLTLESIAIISGPGNALLERGLRSCLRGCPKKHPPKATGFDVVVIAIISIFVVILFVLAIPATFFRRKEKKRCRLRRCLSRRRCTCIL